ncbi:MAG: hypothetical protein RL682_665 [Pseudomonadota bacterium]|jgi:hypothetical protein
MNTQDIDFLLGKIRDTSGLDEFVVVGSLSALGLSGEGLPARMTWSMEVDAYPERDPQRAQEFSAHFGEDSAFHQTYGYYFDAVSPYLPTLPEGWQQRLIRQVLPSGVKVKYLEPNDCAISKYARSEPKDREWIRAGIAAGILSLPTIEYRLRETRFLDQQEHERAKTAIAEDAQWFTTLRGLDTQT